MNNFTLREPPVLTGNYKDDSGELYKWFCELYEQLWLGNFASVQEKKNKKEDSANEGENS